MKHLLQVQDTFQVTGRGLVVVPNTPVAPRFANFTDMVVVEPADSELFQASANFFLSHFSPGGFKLLITFNGLSKGSLPIGSGILVSESAADRLLVAEA
ncbi:hypothetical protein [Stenotrophomonas maltophilia]|uniref:hypothetical protein n=1 Tax=Stenotrophomonas maltophilia TaxID=40324 RepID=UPI0039C364B9